MSETGSSIHRLQLVLLRVEQLLCNRWIRWRRQSWLRRAYLLKLLLLHQVVSSVLLSIFGAIKDGFQDSVQTMDWLGGRVE